MATALACPLAAPGCSRHHHALRQPAYPPVARKKTCTSSIEERTSPMIHSLTPDQQRLLSHRETRLFIFLLSLIREQHVYTIEQLEEALVPLAPLPAQWHQLAHDLFKSSQNGEELFWLSYDIAALDYPPLEQWRSLVALSASVFLPDNP